MAEFVVRNPKAQSDVIGTAGEDRLTVIFTTDGAVLNTLSTSESGASGIFFGPGGSSDDFRFSGIEHIIFDHRKGAGDDFVATGVGNDVISTGAGDDTILSGAGVDKIDGGDGIDLWGADLSQQTRAVKIDLSAPTSKFLKTGSVTGVEGFRNFHGTQGGDVLAATEFAASTIFGEGGDDSIAVYGMAGFSSVNGGAGSDRLVATFVTSKSVTTEITGDGSGVFQAGQDLQSVVAFSGMEHFTITTGSGADQLVTGAGNDVISSGAGNDTIYSGSGVDKIDGGAGVDFWGADLGALSTGVTIDLSKDVAKFLKNGSVSGVEGFSNFRGTQGNDTLINTKLAAATIFGNGGDDVISVYSGRGLSSVDGGDGSDRLVVTYQTKDDVTISLGLQGNGYLGTITGENPGTRDDVAFFAVEHFSITTGAGNDVLTTGFGNDVIERGNNDSVVSGAGDDTIYTGIGFDTVDGGDGVDLWGANLAFLDHGATINLNAKVSTYGGKSAISNIEGFNSLNGTNFNDAFTGTKSSGGTINGAGGDDTITVYGGAGFSSVSGGDGFDRLVAIYNTKDDVAISLFGSSSGYYGTLTGEDTTNRDDVTFERIENFTIVTGSGNDSLSTGFGGDGSGDYSNDSISTGAGNDTIYSGIGLDTIDGGKGVDLWGGNLVYIDHAVTLDLNDKVSSYGGGTAISGVEGFYYLSGTGFGDAFTGTKLSGSTIFGAGGDDTITVYGGAGFSSVVGGEGLDRLVAIYDTADNVTITFNGSGGGYYGTLTGQDTSNHDDIYFESVENFTLVTGSGNDSLTTGFSGDGLSAYGNDNVSTGAGNDTIYTGVGFDTIDGGKGVDIWGGNLVYIDHAVTIDLNDKVSTYGGGTAISGVEGFYYLSGTNFGDTFTGTERSGSTIFGAGGDDTITVYGGAGFSSVNGGEGSDRLVVIYDTSDDVTMQINQSGSGFYGLITGEDPGQKDDVYFESVERFSLTTGSGNDVLTTGSGDDSISSGSGNDTLSGGDGADTILAGAGADLIVGGLGADALSGGADADVFYFGASDSLATPGGFDTIRDFVAGEDRIDLQTVDALLSPAAYAEGKVASDTFDAVVAKARGLMADGSHSVVFVAGKTDGWLFFNTDSDLTTAEGVIRLSGLSGLADFASTDVI